MRRGTKYTPGTSWADLGTADPAAAFGLFEGEHDP